MFIKSALFCKSFDEASCLSDIIVATTDSVVVVVELVAPVVVLLDWLTEIDWVGVCAFIGLLVGFVLVGSLDDVVVPVSCC